MDAHVSSSISSSCPAARRAAPIFAPCSALSLRPRLAALIFPRVSALPGGPRWAALIFARVSALTGCPRLAALIFARVSAFIIITQPPLAAALRAALRRALLGFMAVAQRAQTSPGPRLCRKYSPLHENCPAA